ncbi:MAG TPA: DUF58 domain-containing protein [Gemmatimonadaceae bacterium]|nr:DUF58 domain-containing protein [Gemmatimonadaceae bacterium]
MTAVAPEPTNFLDPGVLAKIGNLELLARVVVQGFINGLHRSPNLGSSTDFAEHRAYMPGDDIRRIDWRLWGRTDRFYVKEFEADTNTNFLVVLDVSPSMRYRGAPEDQSAVSKIAYGCYLAAALAYFSSLQRDRVGLATIDGELLDYVPPSAKHLQQVLHALARRIRLAPDASRVARTALLPPLTKLSESTRRRSIIAVISDLYEEPDAIMEAIGQLHGRGNDIVVFHLLDRNELEFPFSDSGNFIDLETGEKMPVIPDYFRKQYRELVRGHTTDLARRTRDQRVEYALFDTSKPLDKALFAYLSARERLGRVR